MRIQHPDPYAESIEAVQKIDQLPLLLDVCARATGMRFIAIARVTEDRWVTCASLDQIAFGLSPGDELDVNITICRTVRLRNEVVVIPDTEASDEYRAHPARLRNGVRSYVSVPIVRASGEFFGTLCAVDPEPRDIDTPEITGMFELFAQLIAGQIDSYRAIERSEAALVSERETAKLREEFIAIVGHDLRNPVAALGAGLRLMGRQIGEGDAARRLLSEMERTVLRTHKIIDNLLDFARGRLGEGIVAERAADVDLHKVISDIAGEIQSVTSHPIELRLDLDRFVHCDPQRIGQLVSNLLSNAVTHGAPDSAIVLSAAADARCLRLDVENTGAPIPPETHAALFEPFARGKHASLNGLGLGLYISSEIARAHGGRIDVSSDASRTVFTFTMPLDPPAP